MRLSKLIIPILIVSITGACSGLFNDDSDGPELQLQTTQSADQITTFNGDTLVFIPIEYREGPIYEYDFPEFTSEIRNNQIVINGYYLASSAFTPEGTIVQKGNKITIRIHMPEDLDLVANVPEGYLYDAYISNLSNKEYTVEILHRNDGLRRGSAEEDITVFNKEFVIQ